MAYLGTPGGYSGNLHTEYFQERNGNFSGGIPYEVIDHVMLWVMCELQWVVDTSVMALVLVVVGVSVVE